MQTLEQLSQKLTNQSQIPNSQLIKDLGILLELEKSNCLQTGDHELEILKKYNLTQNQLNQNYDIFVQYQKNKITLTKSRLGKIENHDYL